MNTHDIVLAAYLVLGFFAGCSYANHAMFLIRTVDRNLPLPYKVVMLVIPSLLISLTWPVSLLVVVVLWKKK